MPPPPQKDQSYTQAERLKRLALSDKHSESKSDDTGDGDGWIVIGEGSDVHKVKVQSPAERSSASLGPPVIDDSAPPTPADSASLDVPAPGETTLRRSISASSSRSSTTTVSRPSPPPSIDLRTDSDPPYEPMDVGDEGNADSPGQADRKDGRVEEVFKLHSSRRMKPTSKGRGVSIPSREYRSICSSNMLIFPERRWCRYVHLLFTQQAPPSYLAPSSPRPARVKLTSVTLLMHPPSGWKKPLASLMIGGHSGAGQGKAWIKVARYDDSYVEELQRRGGGGEGVGGTKVSWGGVAGDGHWDSDKMFRGCGKLQETEEIADDVKRVLPQKRDVSRSVDDG